MTIDSSSQAPMQWSTAGGRISVNWPQSLKPHVPTPRLFDRMECSLRLDGDEVRFDQWRLLDDCRAVSAHDGVELMLELSSEGFLRARAINRSSKSRKFDAFVFRVEKADADDLLSIPGRSLRVFREGWTMASATGSVGLGECDFKVNPEYKPFAVSAPEEYVDSEPNRFSGEYATVIRDATSNACVLVGFVSSADQMTRIAVTLADSGVQRLEAIAYTDGIELAPDDEVTSEELVVLAGRDGYALLEEFGLLWGRRMGALTWSHWPTGWCSWYYYFEKVTERDVLENVAWIKERNQEFPLEYVQIDDGYQSALGDWLVCNEKFPGGLQFLAGEIRRAGFKPGLWLAPFMVEERSQLFCEHPDWMIRSAAGETVWVTNWRGSRVAALDATIPAAEQWLTETFAALVAMGFEYVKLDFLMYECGALALGGRYADRKATRAQALRRGLAAIRRGMGDKFILGCTSPLGPEVGLVNGARIGTDITPYWCGEGEFFKEAPCVINVCRNVINRAYMNGRLWVNDPDTHIARLDNNKLTEDEVMLWTSALWLTGGLLLLGDRLSTLTPERMRLAKALLENLGSYEKARPLDFLEREYPALWLARSKHEAGVFALGVFNFGEISQSVAISLPPEVHAKSSRFQLTDVWSGEDLGVATDSFSLTLPPHSCKLIRLCSQ